MEVRLRWVLLATLMLASPALAATEGDSAERTRLQEVLAKLSSKGAWKGVERTYPKLVELDGLAVMDHLLAARASLHLGDTHQAHLRLQRALAIEPGDATEEAALAEVRSTLVAINEGYGRVYVVVEPGRKARLTPLEMPFETQPRASIEHAQGVLSSTRRFRGWIPVGRYDVDGVAFLVQAGEYWKEITISAQE